MRLAFLARSNKWRQGLFAAALACSALSGGFAAAAEGDGDPCVEEWLPGFGVPGLNGDVLATTTWDPDGSGPQSVQLVAGGNFTTVGGVNNIARWDGSTWQPFGTGMNSSVWALTTWDPDGSGPQPAQLVAGGLFTTAGGVTMNRIARWDGSAWQPFGTGMNSTVLALTTWDPDGSGPQPAQLVAGGQFTTAGGVAVNFIARWDGSAWQPFGTGMNDWVYALTTWDPDGSGPQPAQLVAGGRLTTAGGSTVNRIARWDGSAWQPFGTGMDGSTSGSPSVRALTTWDPDGSGPQPAQLVAGGGFTTAGGVTVNRIARWDGSTWQPFGTGMSSLVESLTTWDPDGSGPQPAQPVAGGFFTTAGGVTVNRIARWDGSAWQPFGTGMSSEVYALTTWDPDGSGPQPAQLVAGGYFTAAGGVPANRIARWNGSAWQTFGTGMSGGTFPYVYALTTWDPDGSGPQPAQLVAGGGFTTAGGVTVNRIARWDGSTWQPFGTGMSSLVESLTTWDPDGSGPQPAQLVAGGAFTTAGGVAANYIARWDGSAWQPFGTGMSSLVESLTTWDPDGRGPQPAQLVAGGDFTTAGGVTVNRIARWDGSTWQPFGTGMMGIGVNPTVRALSTWDPVGSGPQPAQLVAGGEFTTAGGVASGYIAFWGCPDGVPCLRGDANGDDAVDFNDIDCFVSALVGESTWLSCAAGLDAATFTCANDCDCNGVVNPDDIDCFVQCLVAGECPPCP